MMEETQAAPYTDTHVHPWRRGGQSRRVKENMRHHGRCLERLELYIPPHFIADIVDGEFDHESYLAHARKAKVGRALILAVAPNMNGNDYDPQVVEATNAFHLEAQRAHPEELVIFGAVNPLQLAKHQAHVTCMLDLIGAHGAGVKMHTLMHGFSPSDPDTLRLVEQITERRLPTHWHTGLMDPRHPLSLTIAGLIPIYEQACAKVAAPMNIGHLGGKIMDDDELAFLKEHPAIFLDMAFVFSLLHVTADTPSAGGQIEHDGRWNIAFTLGELRNIERIINSIGRHRILFTASDYPNMSVTVMMHATRQLCKALSLSPEDTEDVLAGNPKRFFRQIVEFNPDKKELLAPFIS